MALLVLFLLGATLGWVASILARKEAVGAILWQIGIGATVALLAGLLTNGGSPLGGLSLIALGAATAAAIVALVIHHAVLSRDESANA